MQKQCVCVCGGGGGWKQSGTKTMTNAEVLFSEAESSRQAYGHSCEIKM
jgi:hypothetical protein